MPSTTIRGHSVSCRLSNEPAQAGFARLLARKALSGWGFGEHGRGCALVDLLGLYGGTRGVAGDAAGHGKAVDRDLPARQSGMREVDRGPGQG